MENKKFYVTTAIDYVNSKPHIGHAWEKIAADILARWHRNKGEKVFFLTGTDEHGLKVQNAAERSGRTPKEFVDELVEKYFVPAWKALNISYDFFIRTSSPEHEKKVKELIKRIWEKGDIYKGKYEGLYCVSCEQFYTEKDLIDGKLCPIHKKPVEKISEDAYFFKLSKYQAKLLELYKKNPEFLSPKKRSAEIINRVEEGLNDLCISRNKKNLKWGVELPFDKEHVLYVWLDALPNYITALDWPNGENFKVFWPADVHLVGKEISWFHSVIWPAMLMSAGIELPRKIFAHGWLTFDGQKISKSLGASIDPIEMANKYGSDSIRYYMFREIPFGEDGDFSEKLLVRRHNDELANDLGNLVNRTLVMTEKYFNGKIPVSVFDKNKEKLAIETFEKADKYINEFKFHFALTEIFNFISDMNRYINEKKPWTVKDKEKLSEIIYTLLESIRVIAILLEPFMPNTSRKIFDKLGLKKIFRTSDIRFGLLKKGSTVTKGDVLFQKIEYKEEGSNLIAIEDFSKIEMKIGEIKNVEDIEGSDKLIKLKVDIGGEERQLVAGLKNYYSKDELIGKKIVVVTNLKHAKLRGVLSEGMLLAAEDDNGNVSLLTIDRDIANGSKIR